MFGTRECLIFHDRDNEIQNFNELPTINILRSDVEDGEVASTPDSVIFGNYEISALFNDYPLVLWIEPDETQTLRMVMTNKFWTHEFQPRLEIFLINVNTPQGSYEREIWLLPSIEANIMNMSADIWTTNEHFHFTGDLMLTHRTFEVLNNLTLQFTPSSGTLQLPFNMTNATADITLMPSSLEIIFELDIQLNDSEEEEYDPTYTTHQNRYTIEYRSPDGILVDEYCFICLGDIKIMTRNKDCPHIMCYECLKKPVQLVLQFEFVPCPSAENAQAVINEFIDKDIEEEEKTLALSLDTRRDTVHRLIEALRESRERNLIFYGIEQDNNEDCRERIRKVIEENMQTTEKINITRCHRLSRKPGAPILVEVPEQNDRSTLFKAAFNLRGTRISLSKDYSRKMREQRRVLNVKRRELVEKGTLAKLRDNKLIINGIAYKQADRKQSLVNSQPNDTFSLTCWQRLPIDHPILPPNRKTRNTCSANHRHSNYPTNKPVKAKGNPLRIIYWNINGFFRISSVFSLFDYLKLFDIFAVTETWCHYLLDLAIEDFDFYQSPAVKPSNRGRSSGGILVGIRKEIQGLIYKVEIEPKWISVIFKLASIADPPLVCAIFVYLPPSELQLENLKKLLCYVENKMQQGFEIVLGGDLNIRIGYLGAFHNLFQIPAMLSVYRTSRDPTVSPLAETLVDFLDDNSLTILNGRSISDKNGCYTFISHQGSSVLDLFMVSPALLELVLDLSIESLPYSDHLPLLLKLNGSDNTKAKSLPLEQGRMEKKRKIDSECRKFKDQWNIQYFVIESSNKALCLICNESIAVLKEYNMKRHYETKHSQNYSKYTGIVRTEKIKALKRGLKSQQSLFTKFKTEQEAATRASFRVALEIAKRGKPFTDGEMIKECIIAVVEEMCPEKVNLLKTVSMSANTVARRVENIAENISSQLFDKNGHVEWFSLALDESTDVSDTAQVLLYIRGVDKSYEVHEELLDMYSIHGTTTGTDIFKGVEMAINKKNLRWKNLKCITTDGGKNMSGKDKGVIALVSKAVENDGGSKPLVLHCIIHQQSLCGKCLDMSDVLKPVISTVNFIRSFGLNHQQFRQFIAEIGETDLPYHTAHRPLTEFQNNAWLWKLAFYVDLTKHVNELNLRLQGENQHLPDLYTNIKSFRMKLILFQSQLRSKCFSHFKTCEIFSHTTETEFPIDFAIETLSALKINFDTRFSDFDAIANQIKIFQNPFDADIETLAPELQMEMIDLQCSDIIKNKYEHSSLLEFYKSLPLTQFDNLHKFARGLFSVFSTTYLCEKTFSKMNMSPRAGQNLSAGRMWPSGRSLETPALEHTPVKKFTWSINKASTYELCLEDLNALQLPEDASIDLCADTLTSRIQTSMMRAGMLTKGRADSSRSKPWFDGECYTAKTYIKKNLKLYLTLNTPIYKDLFITSKRKYLSLLKYKKNKYSDSVQAALSNVRDSAEFWKIIASFKKRNSIKGNIDISEWESFYQGLLSSPQRIVADIPTLLIPIDSELDAEISPLEIAREIASLKNNKAAGYDSIPNEAIKALPENGLILLSNLLNKILTKSQVPSQWSKTIIQPIFKNGDPNAPSNYRGIALISNLSKLFTSIFKNRLSNLIENRKLIAENQAGIRRGYSCQDHIFTLTSLIQMTLNRKRRKLYAFFVDLKKAFDSVPHLLLWRKLALVGLSGRFIKIIQNYYAQMMAAVRWNGSFTEFIKIQSGVLQGEPLSPYLFIIFINDLVATLDDSDLPARETEVEAMTQTWMPITETWGASLKRPAEKHTLEPSAADKTCPVYRGRL
ncbi:EPM2AIP1 [Cordylochernes scorpioides]|uniref:EPM2AIP1 n=1 Tax=Cordylochernes scorpioides TaxID=51811 RepID=A0ABY6LQD1_9ARAC|nr:EPM2AIP1 [Cordylochernes scorpioides]